MYEIWGNFCLTEIWGNFCLTEIWGNFWKIFWKILGQKNRDF